MCIDDMHMWNIHIRELSFLINAAVAQWVRALSPQAGNLAVRIQAATHLSGKNGSDISTGGCLTLGNRCEYHGSSEMTIINGCPMSQ